MTQPLPPNPNLPPEQLPDVTPLADAHQAALDQLRQEWAGLTDKQKAALVDAVYTAVAAGTVADLLTLPIDVAGTSAALTAAMVAIAATAAHLLAAEAADQGVHVPAVHVPAAVFEPTAQVVAGTLGDELRITAARAALQYGPDANPTDVADAARTALDARSGASETKQLGGALHGAMNTGRLASLRRAPTGAVYAQEMNDKNTCGPCREVNGRWLGNIPDDLPQILAMYPDGAYGGYISCLGGINCRGTITGVWRPDQVEATNRARILAKGGQHRDHHRKPDYTPADLGLTDLHDTQVDPQDVNVDRQHYQRDLDPAEVDRFCQHPKRLAKRWGLLARRPDGSLWVVNGQHHTQAGVDEGIRQMRYRVFDSSGPAQEGKVYAAYQRWHDGWHAARPDEPRNRVRVEFNPDQPRDPDGKWSKLGALIAGIASGIAHEDQLGGGQQGVTKLAVFNNGTTGIHKTVSDLTSYTMRPAKHDVDAEELAADLAHRLGIVSPTVHRDGEHSFWQSVVPGTLGASLDEAQAAKLADTDQGRVVGLLDIILNNHDRNPGNWLAEHPDNPHAPGIGVIDHGMAFDTQSGHEIYGALDAFGTDDFVRHYKVRNPDPVDGPDSPYVFGDNDLSPQDIRTAKKALTEMRPEFERLGHLDWWELAYARLAAVGEHAAGTKVRIHA